MTTGMKTIEQIFRHNFIAAGAKHENISFEKAEEIFDLKTSKSENDREFWASLIICVQKTYEEYQHQFFTAPEDGMYKISYMMQNALPSQVEENEIKMML